MTNLRNVDDFSLMLNKVIKGKKELNMEQLLKISIETSKKFKVLKDRTRKNSPFNLQYLEEQIKARRMARILKKKDEELILEKKQKLENIQNYNINKIFRI